VTTVPVPPFPPDIDRTAGGSGTPSELRVASPVLGAGQWVQYTKAALWGLAQCGSLVLAGPNGGASPGSSDTWRYYIWPRYQCSARLWCVTLWMPSADLDSHQATGTFEIPGGTIVGRWTLDKGDYQKVRTFQFVESVSSPSASPGEVVCKLTNASTSDDDVFVTSIACYEIRRNGLVNFGPTPSSLGTFHVNAPNPSTVQTGAPIAEDDDTSISAQGTMRTIIEPTMLMAEARRGCLFSHFHSPGFDNDTTSYVNAFAEDIPVLARFRYISGVTGTIRVAAYCVGSANSKIKFTASSGDSIELDMPTGATVASADWVVDDLDIDSEDASSSSTHGGLRGGTRDTVAVEIKRGDATGLGTSILYGVCMGEAA